MAEDHGSLADDYCLLWDVSAPDDLADRLFSQDVIDHNPQPGQGGGLDGIKQIVGLYHAIFPDLHVRNEDAVISGDRVAVRWSATGTHEGDQLGVPATHRRVHLSGIDILRIEQGTIAERWGEENGLGMMQQITSP